MKKFLTAFALILLTIFMCSPVLADDTIKIIVNDKEITTDVPPIIVNGRTLVPVRAITEALNCDVAWDGETSGITIYRKDHFYEMWIDKKTAFDIKDGTYINYSYTMDVPPTVINDRTLVPLRAVAELLGAEVNWHGDTKTVTVDMDMGELEQNKGIASAFAPYEKAINRKYDLYDNYVHDTEDKLYATIVLQSGDKIELELYPEIAPLTCQSFVDSAKSGLYNGTIFHRVIKDFMIQGGGMDSKNKPVKKDYVRGEFISNGFLNLLPHNRGTISMARATHPDSASSQFFIMHKDTPGLNGNYAAFGKVIKGMEVVDKIATTKTDENDRPKDNIVIKSITIKE